MWSGARHGPITAAGPMEPKLPRRFQGTVDRPAEVSLPLLASFPFLALGDNPGVRCGVLHLALRNQQSLCEQPGVRGPEALPPELCCRQDIPSRSCEGKDALCLRPRLSRPLSGLFAHSRPHLTGGLSLGVLLSSANDTGVTRKATAGRKGKGHPVPPEPGLLQKRKQVAGFLPVPKSELECDRDRSVWGRESAQAPTQGSAKTGGLFLSRGIVEWDPLSRPLEVPHLLVMRLPVSFRDSQGHQLQG